MCHRSSAPGRPPGKRHFRWSKDGTYRQMVGLVAGVPAVADDQVGLLGMMLSADSTIVRAHQHAAGARKASGDPEATSTVPPGTGGAA